MAKKLFPLEAYRKAADRLHHLSLRYVGAIHEVAAGKQIGLVARDHPGNRECRDLIDLVLFLRAEVNAISKILTDAKIVSHDEFTAVVTAEYEFFTKVKAEFLGCEVTDAGLKFGG